jgi:hypothetical protein
VHDRRGGVAERLPVLDEILARVIRQLPLAASVRRDHVDVVVAVAVAREGDAVADRRPGSMRVVAGVSGDPRRRAARRGDDVELLRIRGVAGVHDPRAVGGPVPERLSSPGAEVAARTSEPSAAMVKTSTLPRRSDSKAMRQFGPTRGFRSEAGEDAVRFTAGVVPSRLCRYTSQSPSRLLAKTIDCPSGAQDGLDSGAPSSATVSKPPIRSPAKTCHCDAGSPGDAIVVFVKATVEPSGPTAAPPRRLKGMPRSSRSPWSRRGARGEGR